MRTMMVLLTAVALSGCYTYVPAEAGEPTRGTAVRAHLNPTAAIPIGEVAVQQTATVAGEVVDWNSDHLVLSAHTLISAAGQDYLGRGYTVELPRSSLVFVEEKKLSTWRTALLSGGIIAGGVLLGILAQEGFGSDSGEDGGGQPQ